MDESGRWDFMKDEGEVDKISLLFPFFLRKGKKAK